MIFAQTKTQVLELQKYVFTFHSMVVVVQLEPKTVPTTN